MKNRRTVTAENYRFTLFMACLFLFLCIPVTEAAAENPGISSEKNSGDPPATQGPTRSEVFRLNGPGTLQISNQLGDITIRDTDSDEIRIEMFEKKTFTLWGQPGKSDHRVIIVRNENNITLNIEPGAGASVNRPRTSPEISFVVYAPPYMEVHLKTGFGNISARGLGRSHDIRTGAGNIVIERSMGEGRILTSAGNISILRYKGSLMCLSAGGNITLEDIQGDVKAKTMGGHIRADRVNGSLQAESAAGNINTKIISIKEGLFLHTNVGNITAELPTGEGLDIVMRGSSAVLGDGPTFKGSRRSSEIDGIIQGGGPPVNIFTNAGKAEIIFVRKTP